MSFFVVDMNEVKGGHMKDLKIIVHDLDEILKRPVVADRMKEVEAMMRREEDEAEWEAQREFEDKHRG